MEILNVSDLAVDFADAISELIILTKQIFNIISHIQSMFASHWRRRFQSNIFAFYGYIALREEESRRIVLFGVLAWFSFDFVE